MQDIIQKAIQICWDNRSVATPNPTVYACVIDSNGKIIAEGLTQPYPGKHAERVALEKAGNKAKGATLFVTLEPCSHHGKNPPCTDAIIESDIVHVIYAIDDPFLKGSGVKTLRAAGIKVDKLKKTEEFNRIFQGFFQRITSNRPYIIHKVAHGSDGLFVNSKDKDGNRPIWLTSAESRRDVHLWRSRSCAILSSLQSIQNDQSQLDIRMGVTAPRHPDIFALSQNPEHYHHDIQRLQKMHSDRKIHIVTEENIENFTTTHQMLSGHKVNNLYIEVGSELSHKMIEAQLADEYHIYTPQKNYCDNPLYHRLISIADIVSSETFRTDTKITLKAKP